MAFINMVLALAVSIVAGQSVCRSVGAFSGREIGDVIRYDVMLTFQQDADSPHTGTVSTGERHIAHQRK